MKYLEIRNNNWKHKRPSSIESNVSYFSEEKDYYTVARTYQEERSRIGMYDRSTQTKKDYMTTEEWLATSSAHPHILSVFSLGVNSMLKKA